MYKVKGAASLKDTWFRTGGFTSTLIVPATPDGSLAEKVRMNLEKGRQPVGTRIKVIEDGGISSQICMVKSNQFPRSQCGRTDCIICLQKDGNIGTLLCDKSNVGYSG